jgi:hypothetical protein
MRQTRALARKPRKRLNDGKRRPKWQTIRSGRLAPFNTCLTRIVPSPRRLWTSETEFGRGSGQVGRTEAKARARIKSRSRAAQLRGNRGYPTVLCGGRAMKRASLPLSLAVASRLWAIQDPFLAPMQDSHPICLLRALGRQ